MNGPASVRAYSALSISACSVLDERPHFTPRKPRTKAATAVRGRHTPRRTFLSAVPDDTGSPAVAEAAPSRPSSSRCPTPCTVSAHAVQELRLSVERLATEMRRAGEMKGRNGERAAAPPLPTRSANHEQVAVPIHGADDTTADAETAGLRKHLAEAAARDLFPRDSVLARMATHGGGGGGGGKIHKLVRGRIVGARWAVVDRFMAAHEAGTEFFPEPSFLSALRLGATSSSPARSRKPPPGVLDRPLPQLRHAPLGRSISEVQRTKVEMEQRRVAELLARTERKHGLGTASGANVHHCANSWATWLALLQRSKLFADTIARTWPPFDEVRRRAALFHPPRGAARLSCLTAAATVIARHYRVRKAARRRDHAATLLQAWALTVVRRLKLNVAVHQYLGRVRRVQRAFRRYRAMITARREGWSRQWAHEEGRALRLVALTRDEAIAQAVREKGHRGAAVAAIGQPVGPHLTQCQRKERALLRRRVEELHVLESDALLREDFFPSLLQCGHLRPTPTTVVTATLREAFDGIQRRRAEEQRKRVRLANAHRRHLLEYCHEARVAAADAPEELRTPPVLPQIPQVPKRLRRAQILGLVLQVQRENQRPMVTDEELQRSSTSVELGRAASTLRRGPSLRALPASEHFVRHASTLTTASSTPRRRGIRL